MKLTPLIEESITFGPGPYAQVSVFKHGLEKSGPVSDCPIRQPDADLIGDH